jgi:hypothetical protein
MTRGLAAWGADFRLYCPAPWVLSRGALLPIMAVRAALGAAGGLGPPPPGRRPLPSLRVAIPTVRDAVPGVGS